MWTRRHWFPVSVSVAPNGRAHPGAERHTVAVPDRFANGSGGHRVAPAHPNAGCDRYPLTQAHGPPDAAADREADRAPHGPPDGAAHRQADSAPNAAADREAHAHAVAAEQTHPARPADE